MNVFNCVHMYMNEIIHLQLHLYRYKVVQAARAFKIFAVADVAKDLYVNIYDKFGFKTCF